MSRVLPTDLLPKGGHSWQAGRQGEKAALSVGSTVMRNEDVYGKRRRNPKKSMRRVAAEQHGDEAADDEHSDSHSLYQSDGEYRSESEESQKSHRDYAHVRLHAPGFPGQEQTSLSRH
ncbi:hypothetical protein LZ554_005053 [Drepanopeziza brunnea f. sp. 'monogermtubi']|nr:hypothetical protein LZ554_005053 [Drepanopeziza brunnea f. sp. 'monogermtubi']